MSCRTKKITFRIDASEQLRWEALFGHVQHGYRPCLTWTDLVIEALHRLEKQVNALHEAEKVEREAAKKKVMHSDASVGQSLVSDDSTVRRKAVKL